MSRLVSGGELITFLISKDFVVFSGDGSCEVLLCKRENYSSLASPIVNIMNNWNYDVDIATVLVQQRAGFPIEELWEFLVQP